MSDSELGQNWDRVLHGLTPGTWFLQPALGHNQEGPRLGVWTFLRRLLGCAGH